MENTITYYAKNQESIISYIESNYGQFTTGWHKTLGGSREAQIDDRFYVREYTGECGCGECPEYSVFDLDNNCVFTCKECESCYEDEFNQI